MFYLLSFFAALVSLDRGNKSFIFIFLLFLMCFPFSNAFAPYFYNFGLYVYDFFFVITFFMIIKDNILHGKVIKNSFLLHVVIILAFYALVGFYFGVDKYYLRDFRVLIFTIECYVLFNFGYYFGLLSVNKIILLSIFSSLSNVFYFLLFYFGFVDFEDSYYVNNSFRYFDVSTYVAAIYFTFSYLFIKRNDFVYKFSMLAAFLCIVCSGSRAILIASFISIAILNYRFLIKNLIPFLFGSVVLGAYLSTKELELINRLINMSPEVVVEHLYVRYEPFFILIDSYSLINYLIGGGFGTVFQIPWFEYRDLTVDPLNNFIDTTFFTLYAKFGFFCIPLIAVYYFYFIKSFDSINYMHSRLLKVMVFLFLTLLMLVYAIPYQASSIGLLIGLYFLTCLNQSNIK